MWGYVSVYFSYKEMVSNARKWSAYIVFKMLNL